VDVQQASAIINAIEDGWTILAVAVPTRGLRVVYSTNAMTFRVQQLMPGEGYTWNTVSSHTGDLPWESYGAAMQDMIDKQARLKEKIKLAQRNATKAVA
jgi:hypothetical protein